MSKKGSKEKRKQEAAKAAITAKQEENFAKKNPDYVKPEKNQKGKKPEEDVQIKMNFYSAMAMITTLIAAGTAALAMIVWSSAKTYLVQSKCGDAYDADVIVNFLDDEKAWGNFVPYLTIALVAIVIVTVMALIMTMTAMNAYKKPSQVMAIAMAVLSAVALVMYVLADIITKDIPDKLKQLDVQSQFGIYNVYLIVLIVNLAVAVINIFGTLYGCSNYKKTGHTC